MRSSHLLFAAIWAMLGGSLPAEMPPAHFHHIHLNTTDPAAAIDFYTAKFNCE
jgi:hypothetical protein